MTTSEMTGERTELLGTLARHRRMLRFTTRDLTDEQAATRPTVSELCLGGLLKHVTRVEGNWCAFLTGGPAAMGGAEDVANGFRMLEDETLAGLLAGYQEAARRTDETVAGLPGLDVSHPVPPAPWFEPDVRWTARRVLLHLIAETAQHAGHADIIRESLDGATSTG